VKHSVRNPRNRLALAAEGAGAAEDRPQEKGNSVGRLIAARARVAPMQPNLHLPRLLCGGISTGSADVGSIRRSLVMPDSVPPADAGEDLAAALRGTIARFRGLLEAESAPQKRRSIERLLAEAEAALSELEIPEEG
jgi:hypothetical protein